MYSAFGVDHGDSVAKGLKNPFKAVKVARSARKLSRTSNKAIEDTQWGANNPLRDSPANYSLKQQIRSNRRVAAGRPSSLYDF